MAEILRPEPCKKQSSCRESLTGRIKLGHDVRCGRLHRHLPGGPEQEPFVPPYVTTPPVRHRDRTRIALILTTCLLVLALGAGSAAYLYTNNSSREWKATAEQHLAELADMTAQRQQVQGQLDASQAALAQTKSALQEVTEQYDDASDRIRDLADEKAQAADTVGVLGSAVERSRNVALQLDRCVAGSRSCRASCSTSTATRGPTSSRRPRRSTRGVTGRRRPVTRSSTGWRGTDVRRSVHAVAGAVLVLASSAACGDLAPVAPPEARVATALPVVPSSRSTSRRARRRSRGSASSNGPPCGSATSVAAGSARAPASPSATRCW